MALELAPFRLEEFTTWLFLRDLITEFLANYFLMFSAVIVSQLLNEDQGYTRLEVGKTPLITSRPAYLLILFIKIYFYRVYAY